MAQYIRIRLGRLSIKMIEVYTDAATNGNPGLSGAGIVTKYDGIIQEYSIALGTLTNHEAEFYAVYEALKICNELYPGEILSFYSDSQLVVDAIEKQFVKNTSYQMILQTILNLSADFPYFFIKWIPGRKNKADQLAKQAIHLNT